MKHFRFRLMNMFFKTTCPMRIKRTLLLIFFSFLTVNTQDAAGKKYLVVAVSWLDISKVKLWVIGLLVIQWLRQFVLDFCTLSMAHTMAPLEVIHQEVSEHSMTPLELIVICVGSITAYIGIGTLGTDTVVTRGICTCGICTWSWNCNNRRWWCWLNSTMKQYSSFCICIQNIRAERERFRVGEGVGTVSKCNTSLAVCLR